jgi:hypothetical protein
MRRLILILEAGIVVAGAALAQNSSTGDNTAAPQLPVGQVFKQFEFPAYEGGKLKYTLFATEAKGVTLNRADTSDLKIQIYDDGAVTTTITSPRADLFVAEQRMRTKNTVQVDRADMNATSQTCDFDVKNKKFVMRNNVRVVLKHFDLNGESNGSTPASNSATPAPVPDQTPAPVPAPTADSVTAPAPAPTPVATPTPTTLAPPKPPSSSIMSNLPITPPPANAPASMESTPAPVPEASTNSAPIPPSDSK